MTLVQRLARLEESSDGKLMSAEDRDRAIERYTAAHRQGGGFFPNAMPITAYRHAIETFRSSFSQQLLACWLPGDEDL